MNEVIFPQVQEAILSAMEKMADWVEEQGKKVNLIGLERLYVKIGEEEYLTIYCGRAYSTDTHYLIGVKTDSCDKIFSVYSNNGGYVYKGDKVRKENALFGIRGETYRNAIKLIKNWDKVKQAILKVYTLDTDLLNEIKCFNPNNGCTDRTKRPMRRIELD